jgi:hypothetical protein
MNQREDGSADFVAVQALRVRRCLTKKLCGICGRKLGVTSAFVGGPISAATHAYSNPPFHPECARAAMRLCPYILIGRHKRAQGDRAAHAATPAGMELAKPEHYIMGLAATSQTKFRVIMDTPTFVAGPWQDTIKYTYDGEGKLVYPANG